MISVAYAARGWRLTLAIDQVRIRMHDIPSSRPVSFQGAPLTVSLELFDTLDR